MPISGQYSWNQKNDTVKISIPTKGVSSTDIDIQVTSTHLKVNFSPYLIDILLKYPVNQSKHKAAIVNGVLNLTLYKQTAQSWDSLTCSTSPTLATIDTLSTLAIEPSSLSTSSLVTTTITKEQRKQAQIESRKVAEDENNQYQQQISQLQKDKKTEEERYALRQQISLQEAERSKLDSLKEEEKQQAEDAVYETLSKFSTTASTTTHTSSISNPIANISQVNSTKSVLSTENVTTGNISQYKSYTIDELDDDDNIINGNNDDERCDDEIDKLKDNKSHVITSHTNNGSNNSSNYNKAIRKIPAPRNISTSSDTNINQPPSNTNNTNNTTNTSVPNHNNNNNATTNTVVPIQFSQRHFPTPLRESKVAEEEDWLLKNKKYLKSHAVLGKLSSSLSANNQDGNSNRVTDVSEEDPVWLKAKGDDFFRSSDFRSAISAYTTAIDILNSLLQLPTNTSNNTNTSNSTSDAKSGINGYDDVLILCYANRSNGYLKLSMFHECMYDCEHAIKIFENTVITISNNSGNSSNIKSSSSWLYTQLPPMLKVYITLHIRLSVCCCQIMSTTGTGGIKINNNTSSSNTNNSSNNNLYEKASFIYNKILRILIHFNNTISHNKNDVSDDLNTNNSNDISNNNNTNLQLDYDGRNDVTIQSICTLWKFYLSSSFTTNNHDSQNANTEAATAAPKQLLTLFSISSLQHDYNAVLLLSQVQNLKVTADHYLASPTTSTTTTNHNITTTSIADSQNNPDHKENNNNNTINTIDDATDSNTTKSHIDLALDCYDKALILLPVHTSCLSNRALCKMMKHDYQGCVDDCTTTLSILTMSNNDNYSDNLKNNKIGINTVPTSSALLAPSLNQNNSNSSNYHLINSVIPITSSTRHFQLKLKTLCRRGTAYTLLSIPRYDLAITDYEVAITMDSTNTALQQDLEKIKQQQLIISSKQ